MHLYWTEWTFAITPWTEQYKDYLCSVYIVLRIVGGLEMA
jgi:hypothetical protein